MKGSAEHSVERRRDAFNASNGGRLRGRPLLSYLENDGYGGRDQWQTTCSYQL